MRMTTVKLAAALPLELALHAVVLLAHPPYPVSAVALAVSSTTLAIWVVEPAVVRALGAWLHAPAQLAVTTDDRDPAATTAPARPSPAPATRPWSSTGRAIR